MGKGQARLFTFNDSRKKHTTNANAEHVNN